MKDRAGRYRKIAADVRAKADTKSNEHSRNAMLAAADIWDRLAALAEQLALSAALSRVADGHEQDPVRRRKGG